MNRHDRRIWPATGRLAIAAAGLGASAALAQSVLPGGGAIVSGQGTISTNGNAMTVHQSTDRLITNWQSFSIGKDAVVTFRQPSASSVALNRVVGQSPSQILGAVNANGQVFLVNPNGVLIGRGASVQTGAFAASTLGLADRDFLAGKYHFKGEGGAIVNQGDIKGHVVALIAPVVTNEGSIRGNAALAAGTDALLDFDGDGLLSVQVKASTLAGLVENKGLIQADGGTVILTAKGASGALMGVVNNTGTVQARTIASSQGRILLLGDMDHGEAHVAGTLDASAPHGGGGGFIETSAARVKVADNARISTRAESGKTGTWLIDPNDFTIAATGGNITGTTLSTQLAGSNVTISTATQGTAGGNGDIFVNAPVSWSANTLTLQAERNITFNAAMNATATAGLALEYGQGAAAAGNTARYTVNAPVNLASTGSFSTKLGSDGATVNYTIVTSLGNAGSSNDGSLQGIAGNLSGNYVLGADIDASVTSAWNAGSGFTPLGDNSTWSSASRFGGTFDGLGHAVSGLVINRPATDYIGVFGYVNTGGVVKNVGFSGGSVAGKNNVGQLAGTVYGRVSGSYATGSVSATNKVGGLVGFFGGDSVSNSYATGHVSGVENVGGLIGFQNTGTISSSHATGNVTGSGTYSQAGGLVGFFNGGTISSSYATGQVSGGENVGGLIGFQNSGTISSSYATGQVSGVASVGGLIGFQNSGTISSSYATGQVSGVASVGGLTGFQNNTGTISGSHATGNVTASGAYSQAGGLVGFLYGGTISSSYATGQVSGGENVGGLIGFQIDGTVERTYAAGAVIGTGTGTVGGLVGFAGNGTRVSDSQWDTSTTGQSVGCGTGSTGTCTVTGLTTTQMKNPFTFIDTGWDFSSVWGKSRSGNNNGYMVLRALDSTVYDDYVRLSNTSLSKTYGDANPSLAGISLDGVGTGNASLSWGSAITTATGVGTYAYSAPNVLSVTGINGRNVYADYGSGTLTVGKAALTATANNAVKTYDGQSFSGGDGVSLSGFVNGDSSAVLSGALSYGGTAQGARNVGSYTITASGLSAQNYDIAYANGTLTVNKAAITAVSGITASDKTYDGTTATTLYTANAALTGMIAGDNLNVAGASGAFSDKNAGAGKTVNITGITLGGADAGNYTLAATTATAAADIARMSIAGVTGITANNKTYDGTTAATLNTGTATVTGMVAGDNLNVAGASGAFSDKNAGTGKMVNITGIMLGGVDVGNYTLASSTATATASITKAAVSAVTGISAESKVHDGTATATLNTANAAFTGMIAGDSLNVAGAAGNFANAYPGMNKTVFITGLSLGGADAGNYTLTNTTATTTADMYAVTQPLPPQMGIGHADNNGAGGIDGPLEGGGQDELLSFPDCVKGGNQGGASSCASLNNAQ